MESWRNKVTEDTQIMLETLLDKKKETDGLFSRYELYNNLTMILAVLFVIYTPFFLYFQHEENILFLITDFIMNIFHIIWFVIIAYFHLKQLGYLANAEKFKKKFEALRVETIEHLNNTWYINEHSPTRDQISRYMEQYGINVRYKSN
ncbi:DUF2663 family protein [Virgibacillus sp. C22-A2]|uniref:DUF2663 family protein n=1 Tax=Virgibacillus tibetensis TaxID=3042313 RepID=A0ABU6KDS8_9BACI|nr:DUF2663 family protein [Virgibacillus sp. C22-A2]